ncbi:MAG: hypothetical protein LBS50_04430 [Prevotellaceae bacterium]|jgi:hypothetical protein|nr:hypothetical protein [Prevotellaceae bacterium]
MTPIIFTTGAHLQPIQVKKEDGIKYWVWTVTEFVDDSFKDGKVFNPKESAENLENLLTE